MTVEERLRKIGRRTLVALGLFFGVGFTAGFLTGFEYGFRNRPEPSPIEARSEDAAPLSPSGPVAASPDASPDLAGDGAVESYDEDDDGGEIDSGEFALTEHELGDDENGLFIAGTVVNRSQNAFDAVQVAFELRDAKGRAYTTITDRTTERMEPGDSWGFVVYIPYSEMKEFKSYRLQGIMGVRR